MASSKQNVFLNEYCLILIIQVKYFDNVFYSITYV